MKHYNIKSECLHKIYQTWKCNWFTLCHYENCQGLVPGIIGGKVSNGMKEIFWDSWDFANILIFKEGGKPF